MTSKNLHKRHIAKAVTWRIVGTFDTILLSWLITGNPLTGLKIGGAEVITKMLLYYVHERAWYTCNFGINSKKDRNCVNSAKTTISPIFSPKNEPRLAVHAITVNRLRSAAANRL